VAQCVTLMLVGCKYYLRVGGERHFVTSGPHRKAFHHEGTTRICDGESNLLLGTDSQSEPQSEHPEFCQS
jgi:hypothetical protein